MLLKVVNPRDLVGRAEEEEADSKYKGNKNKWSGIYIISDMLQYIHIQVVKKS